jgi:hypothetical protein
MHAKHGVPPQFRECHIALVGDYVIEGHVPVDSIQRLMKEKPKVMGLVVPGMPAGSPGMEGPNGRPYEVLTFERNGKVTLYERKQPRF